MRAGVTAYYGWDGQIGFADSSRVVVVFRTSINSKVVLDTTKYRRVIPIIRCNFFYLSSKVMNG